MFKFCNGVSQKYWCYVLGEILLGEEIGLTALGVLSMQMIMTFFWGLMNQMAHCIWLIPLFHWGI